VLVWPASQAPYCESHSHLRCALVLIAALDKYGWQSAIALLTLVIILTVGLRIYDVKYLLYVMLSFPPSADG